MSCHVMSPPLPEDPGTEARSEDSEVIVEVRSVEDLLEPNSLEAGLEASAEAATTVEGNKVDDDVLAHEAPTADLFATIGDDGDSSSGSDYDPLVTMWEANGLPIPPDEQRRIDEREERM